MELGAALGCTREQYSDVKAREVDEEQGADVQLLLKLPDGSAQPQRFRMGHTVACVKLAIEKEFGLSMERQQLVLEEGGRPLLDILCLSDYPQIKAGEANAVVVSLAPQ
ncbi:hypothetical protein Rsub_10217 [Raphidocelis subcapitata]|uniref:Ubiquitin-like domain-containing protein n=1 Tax=Raphidocelis subcapitata TaxID=307507 RepID=A0A2V0PFL0_9CHLO|nr:hypothetical protein Rsub_10217 [Raphidocelis subcapitata]|eukprot:GBF97792.1 hypothetical protein Rsub_10217 [Raphidocelis subcapitata]